MYINITLLIYTSTIYSSTYMSGDKLAHGTISSCHIGFKGFLKSVFQILTDKIYFGGKINIT